MPFGGAFLPSCSSTSDASSAEVGGPFLGGGLWWSAREGLVESSSNTATPRSNTSEDVRDMFGLGFGWFGEEAPGRLFIGFWDSSDMPCGVRYGS